MNHVFSQKQFETLEAALIEYALMTPEQLAFTGQALARLALSLHGSSEARKKLWPSSPSSANAELIAPIQELPIVAAVSAANRYHGPDGPGAVCDDITPPI